MNSGHDKMAFLLREIHRYIEMTGDSDPCIVMSFCLASKLKAAFPCDFLLGVSGATLFGYSVYSAPMDGDSVIIGRKEYYGPKMTEIDCEAKETP